MKVLCCYFYSLKVCFEFLKLLAEIMSFSVALFFYHHPRRVQLVKIVFVKKRCAREREWHFGTRSFSFCAFDAVCIFLLWLLFIHQNQQRVLSFPCFARTHVENCNFLLSNFQKTKLIIKIVFLARNKKKSKQNKAFTLI